MRSIGTRRSAADTVFGGTLTVVGSHQSPVNVRGGTLNGNGRVVGAIDVASGVLRPGLSAAEAAVAHTPYQRNNMTAGGDVRIEGAGSLAISIRGDADYTKVTAATGNLDLAGDLNLDVQGTLTPGAVMTIMTGKSISGTFRDLPENRQLTAGGYRFRVSYKTNKVTLTVLRAV